MTLALAILAGVLLALYTAFRAVSWIFGALSGWNRLARTYHCAPPPTVWTARKQTVSVGPIRFRRVVDVGLQPEGLYLRARAIFWYPPLQLPWPLLHSPRTQTIYGRAAVSLAVGRPEAGVITLPRELYQRAAPFLAATGEIGVAPGSA